MIEKLLAFDYDKAAEHIIERVKTHDDKQARAALKEHLGPDAPPIATLLWDAARASDLRVTKHGWVLTLLIDEAANVPVEHIVEALRVADATEPNEFPLALPAKAIMDGIVFREGPTLDKLADAVKHDARLRVGLLTSRAARSKTLTDDEKQEIRKAALAIAATTTADVNFFLHDAGFSQDQIQSDLREILMSAAAPDISNVRIILPILTFDEAKDILGRTQGTGSGVNFLWSILDRKDTPEQTAELFLVGAKRFPDRTDVLYNLAAKVAKLLLSKKKAVPAELLPYIENAPLIDQSDAKKLLERIKNAPPPKAAKAPKKKAS